MEPEGHLPETDFKGFWLHEARHREGAGQGNLSSGVKAAMEMWGESLGQQSPTGPKLSYTQLPLLASHLLSPSHLVSWRHRGSGDLGADRGMRLAAPGEGP
jgi:hypothetical protein